MTVTLHGPVPRWEKVYAGIRPKRWQGDQWTLEPPIVDVFEGEVSRRLDPRLDLRNHSPTGFEWGYGGSGPAQLALALVADCCGDDYATPPIYQRFKSWLVAGLPKDFWALSAEQVWRYVLRAVCTAWNDNWQPPWIADEAYDSWRHRYGHPPGFVKAVGTHGHG